MLVSASIEHSCTQGEPRRGAKGARPAGGDARKAEFLTHSQLSIIASVDQAEISRIERGHANATVATLARIAAATGARVDLVPAQ